MDRAGFGYRVELDSIDKAAQCGLYRYYLASIDPFLQLCQQHAHEPARVILGEGLDRDVLAGTVAHIGQFLDKRGALRLQLRNRALVGVHRGTVSVGQQVDQLANLACHRLQTLLQSDDLAAVNWLVNQIFQRLGDVLDHLVGLKVFQQSVHHSMVDPARRYFFALADSIQGSVHAGVPFAMPRLAGRRDQESGQQVRAV